MGPVLEVILLLNSVVEDQGQPGVVEDGIVQIHRDLFFVPQNSVDRLQLLNSERLPISITSPRE